MSLEIGGWQITPRPNLARLGATQNNLLQFPRPSARRRSQRSAEHVHDGIRNRQVVPSVQAEQFLRLHSFGHQEERHVTDDFAGRGHFHDISK